MILESPPSGPPHMVCDTYIICDAQIDDPFIWHIVEEIARNRKKTQCTDGQKHLGYGIKWFSVFVG